MIDPTVTSPEKVWLPSARQPEPDCLGDFLKLLEERIDDNSPEVPNAHVTTVVNVLELGHLIDKDYEAYLVLIESALQLSKNRWREAHSGGELSKYGSLPDDAWEVGLKDVGVLGWKPIPGEGGGLLYLEDGDKITLVRQPAFEYEEDDS